MKRKTTFLLCVLVGVILLSSALLVYVRAADQNSSHCASYLKDYFDKTEAYQDALETFNRAQVATAKASPSGNVPPDMKKYEDEYDANSKDYLGKLKDGLSTHPNSPSNISGLINGLGETVSRLQLMQVEAAAYQAALAALTAQKEAEKALANCTGQSIVTIWCERGADCQLHDGNTNPKAHYVYDCPDKIEGVFNLNVACPGEWWKCDGSNVCPRSSDHVVPCKGGCGDMVGPDRVDKYHFVTCKSNMAVTGCGQTYWKCNATEKQAHYIGSDGRCRQLPKATKQACGHVYDASSSSAYSHRSKTYTCGVHSGYACQESSHHKTYISSCSETEDGKTCENTSGYYECSPHSHSYPSSSDDDSGKATCSAGHTYKTTGRWASYLANLHRARTCRYSECVQTWQACSIDGWSPICNKPYRKRNGLKCWAVE